MEVVLVALLIVNATVAAVSVAFAVIAVVRPAALSHTSDTPTSGERLYAWMYAAKAVPLGILAAALPLISPGTATMLCLIAAAVSQAADAGIGACRREWGMVAGPAVAAVIHAIAAAAVR